jgi:hypothetical protein
MVDKELKIWFPQRRLEMTGICMHCGNPTCKYDDLYYKHSVAHILPKAIFKSIRAHPLNWIELCFWGNNCHTNYDNKILEISKMNCYDIIIERFSKIYPFISSSEHRRIPDALMQGLFNADYLSIH